MINIYTYQFYLQVIYVKPGYEADLDSLIQDSIRLATSVEVKHKFKLYIYILISSETCSPYKTDTITFIQ